MILDKDYKKRLIIMNLPYISVVLPVFRNETSIRELYYELKTVLENKKFSFEIIFVNDASPDGSALILCEIASVDSRVKVIDLKQNKGQHCAVLKGLELSTGEVAVVMDADLQDPPEVIPSIVSKLREGYDIVFAGRHGHYESVMRIFTSKIFKFFLHKLLKIPKDAGLFVTMNRKAINALETISMPNPFVVAMLGLTGCKICSVPFIRKKQKENRSAYTFYMRLKIALQTLFYVLCNRSHYSHIQQQKKYYAKNDHINIFPENYPSHIQRIIKKTIEYTSIDKTQRILEVGCGMGRFTIPLAKKQFQIEGLDLSSELLEGMKLYSSELNHIPTYCVDLLDPPKALQGKFDVVVGFFILHHMQDLEKTFQSIFSLLKPKGKVFFVEPNPYNLLYYLQIFFHPKMRWKNERNMLYMRKSKIFSVMKDFSNVTIDRFGFFPPFLHQKMQSNEAKLEKISMFKPFLPFQIFYGEKS